MEEAVVEGIEPGFSVSAIELATLDAALEVTVLRLSESVSVETRLVLDVLAPDKLAELDEVIASVADDCKLVERGTESSRSDVGVALWTSTITRVD